MPRASYPEYPLVVKDLRKIYPSVNNSEPKIANKNITLRVANGELFGLLGPNGAGKTTLIQQLTGIYPPSSGNAWIRGHSVLTEINLVQLQIGLCP
jgi:ABC-type multidrug transport system ATPase subunit